MFIAHFQLRAIGRARIQSFRNRRRPVFLNVNERIYLTGKNKNFLSKNSQNQIPVYI